ncbi:MAG: AtpZ/AtpI family protein [Balneolaceae bacterium]|nr:AtpZ/AtpI family protein [Balneolaceae bacterium]MDR9446916.1 AtpZ/AtpI family protein [Balneolaceae bacterium]
MKPKSIERAVGLGVEIATVFSAPILLGYWVQQRWGGEPWGVIAGALLGIVFFLRIGMRLSKEEKKSN